VLAIACVGLLASAPTPRAQSSTPLGCENAKESGLPLPASVPPERLAEYEKQVLAFLKAGTYVTLGWCGDKGVRDTGPWINDTYYGTHKAARVYYSPAVVRWLTGGRSGPIPDGAMIIKEGYTPPAMRYADAAPPPVGDWTVMIKDAKGSRDGWFWGEFWTQPSLMPFDDHTYPFNYPAAGFGLYCTRCHASAEKESTFSSLTNIKGAAGDPLTFRVDDSWRTPSAAALRRVRSHAPAPPDAPPPAPVVAPNPAFLQTFRLSGPVAPQTVARLPNETWDLVVPPAAAPTSFVTSNQCQSCHSAALAPFGPTMYLPTKSDNGVNVSPYTEWRWSPMGLAGRDPIFFAQLESELAYVDDDGRNPTIRRDQKHAIVDLCFRCHGVMGKRQHDLDHPGTPFALENVMRTGSEPGAKYGALARDGVSCASCHHIAPDAPPPNWKKSALEYFLTHASTGLFATGPPDRIFGPFKDEEIVTQPMDNAIGAKPAYSEYVKSARLCGSCHTINLPVIDAPPFRPISPARIERAMPHSIEQATYLEWLNSTYQNELGKPGPKAQTCQDCHMPRGYTNAAKQLDVPQIQTRIAIVEDDSYPAAEHRAPAADIRVRYRQEGFVRHELLGMNALLLEMFRQFNDILGVRKTDYMTGTSDNLEDAQANLFEQARTRTATVQASASVISRTLTAKVTVANLAGHRFPSGVGFRRAFIELLAIETQDERHRLVWSSGRTNDVGVIVDGDGRPLPSEFFAAEAKGKRRSAQAYQPHYETITAGDEVQIYEELTRDARGRFTTSFLRRDHEVKDNRLLPVGWTKQGPDPSLNGVFLEATWPKGGAEQDPDYGDGRGTDTVTYRIELPADVDPARVSVRATLYYQSIPPYYLNDRFTASNGDATRRLYYLTSNLNLSGTPMEHWKIAIASASANVGGAAGRN
jgi:mono/diheme cytochrome c family protein